MAVLMRKISHYTNQVYAVLSILFLCLVILSSGIQVFSRYALNSSIAWTEEFARYAFIWLTMCGTCVASKAGTHAVVDFIVQRFRGRLRMVHRTVVHLLILGICILLIVQSLNLAGVTAAQRSPAMHVPMIYVYMAVPFGALGICIHTLSDLFSLYSPAESVAQAEDGPGNETETG